MLRSRCVCGQAYSSSRDSHAKLTLKESELSGSSSFSDHLSDKAVSAAAIIKRMHPDSLSQVRRKPVTGHPQGGKGRSHKVRANFLDGGGACARANLGSGLGFG